MAPPDPLMVPIETAAEMLGLGRTTTFTLIKTGELPTITVGRRRLVPVDAVRKFVADRLAGSSPDAA
ncbi:MAG TPA: helix-turn-helix domain-containing protein [Acidimicrobiales bacterium]|nr:helix-turn-helix domain-containing protein [Acidimicrobiales bacterium]